MAGVALGDIDLHFAWQAWHLVTWIITWHLWHWAGSGGALGPEWTGWTRGSLRGRRGTFETSTLLSRLGDMERHFAWQARHLWHWAGSGGAPGPEWTGWTPRLFAWQAWHLVTWTCTLRGRRGTW